MRHFVSRAGFAAVCLAASPAFAGYQIGSGNTAVIEPPVPHPAETPCVVTLFANAQFGADNVPVSYTPPPACPGPWARVVLKLDIGLDAGIQYDRTGTLWLGGVNLWFGTTSEPSPRVAPQWRVERDVTEDTALLANPQSGFVLIANYTNAQDTSIITASGSLLFYPATQANPAPATPDLVLPLSAPGGGTVGLSDGTSQLSTTVTLPTNVSDAVLDLFLQSQSGDEFWYTCVPNDLTGPLQSCGGGAFREGEVTIDGVPAGVAPIYPWIYTGGIDPYLWAPLPGVQTLDFKPFRVPLAPFAGKLSDGQPHTVSVSVFGADNYFSATGTLYVTLDHNTGTVTGAVTRNTLTAAPNPKTVVTQGSVGANQQTRIGTTSRRDFTITGTAVTSAGTVTTTVHETTAFRNDQNFLIGNTLYAQRIDQDTETLVDVTRKVAGGGSTERRVQYSYPLNVAYAEHVLKSGNITLPTAITQTYRRSEADFVNGAASGLFDLVNSVTPKDTLLLNAQGQLTGHENQSSTATYLQTSTYAGCFQRTLTAAGSVLTGATTTRRCK